MAALRPGPRAAIGDLRSVAICRGSCRPSYLSSPCWQQGYMLNRKSKCTTKKPLTTITGAKPDESEFDSVDAPLEPQTWEGSFLCGLLKSQPHIFLVAAAKQLQQMSIERKDTLTRWEHSIGSSEDCLHRRIAKMKEQECRTAIEDVMYVLIVHKYFKIEVPMVPNLSKLISNRRLHIWPPREEDLESIHGPEVLGLIREHLTSIIRWVHRNGPKINRSTLRVKRLQLGRIYSASIMYGYFLKSVTVRHRLDLTLARPQDFLQPIKRLNAQLAIHKRENTLLKEFQQSAKSSVFHDRRIGERDETLPDFDKAILRQQREHMAKLKRVSKYNLSDEEEEEDGIHHSHTLSGNDDFDEEVPLGDDSDDEGKIALSKKRLSLQSSGPRSEIDLPEETHGHKSKKEVMSEIILKSKFYKAQKAKEKEEDEHLVDKLDSDFALFAQTPALLSLTESARVNAHKNNSSTIHKDSSGLSGKEIFNKEKPDAYDKLVKEMVMDQRARPSDRTKTPEELAQEEKERLEELEKERHKRMIGTAESSDEDDDDEEGDHHMKADNSKAISGDDLGDSFSFDKSTKRKKGWVDEIYEKEGRKIGEDVASGDERSEDSGEDEGEDEDDEEDAGDEDDSSDNDIGNMPARDWEQSDDDEVAVEDEKDDVKEKEQVTGHRVIKTDAQILKRVSNAKQRHVEDEDLPFVIEAPNNLQDLCSLVDGRSETEIVEIISRIRICNSIRLTAENRKKMQVFYGVLLQYFAVLATKSPVKFEVIETLVKPLIEMTEDTPYFAAICARERLIHTRTRLCEDIKVPGKSSWPSLKTLLLLRLWSLIFPCSDFRHAVATPMLLLMCEYLMRCPIQSGRDVAVGSFLCSMVLAATKESKKFCPEAISFLQTLLLTSLKGEVGNQINDHFMELKTLKPWLHVSEQVQEVNRMNIIEVMSMDPDSPFFSSDNFKAGVLLSVAECLRGFVIIHEELPSFPEIFMPISSLLQQILEKSDLPVLLREIFHEVIDFIKKRSDEHYASREPLQMRKQKPEPIKQLNPKFEENYIKSLDYDPDPERAQLKKLKKRLKSEKKGAVRELRKDNYFLSAVKEKDRIKKEQERAEKYGKAMAFLQEQESAFKSGQLGKGKKRRR